MRTVNLLLLVLIAVLTVPASAADVFADGREQLARGEFGAARNSFTQALMSAGDEAAKARAYFYLAVVEEEDASEGSVTRAADYYRKALASDPMLASAANNLAQLLSRAGDRAEAIRLQKLAAESKDPRGAFYQQNLAQLVALDDPAEAIRLYREVLTAEPNDTEAEAALLGLDDGEGVTRYLWSRLGAGDAARAQQRALEQLTTRRHTATVKRALLNIAAVALAQQHTPPSTYHALLAPLDGDSNLQQGARELRQLVDSKGGADGSYNWWTADRGVSSSNTFNSFESLGIVARDIAQQHVRAGRKADAEQVLKNVIAAGSGEDADAVLALVELYYAGDQKKDIEQLLKTYENNLFNEKTARYLRGDWAGIYRLHAALGTIYTALKIPGDESNRTSAIFQLERARMAAEQNNADPAKKKIYVDPKLIDRLAQSYSRASRDDRAAEVRIDAADKYLLEGRSIAAVQTIEPVKKDVPRLSPTLMRKYTHVQQAIAPRPNPSTVRYDDSRTQFATGSSGSTSEICFDRYGALSADAQAKLTKVAEQLRTDTSFTITLRSAADSFDSMRPASSASTISDYLMKAGVSRSQMRLQEPLAAESSWKNCVGLEIANASLTVKPPQQPRLRVKIAPEAEESLGAAKAKELGNLLAAYHRENGEPGKANIRAQLRSMGVTTFDAEARRLVVKGVRVSYSIDNTW